MPLPSGPPFRPQTDFLFGFLFPLICLWTLEEVSSSLMAFLYCPDDLWTTIFPSHQQTWTNVIGFLLWKGTVHCFLLQYNKQNWEDENTLGSHAPFPCLFSSGRLELLYPLLHPLSQGSPESSVLIIALQLRLLAITSRRNIRFCGYLFFEIEPGHVARVGLEFTISPSSTGVIDMLSHPIRPFFWLSDSITNLSLESNF